MWLSDLLNREGNDDENEENPPEEGDDRPAGPIILPPIVNRGPVPIWPGGRIIIELWSPYDDTPGKPLPLESLLDGNINRDPDCDRTRHVGPVDPLLESYTSRFAPFVATINGP